MQPKKNCKKNKLESCVIYQNLLNFFVTGVCFKEQKLLTEAYEMLEAM